MKLLWLRRIVMMALLIVAIGGLAVVTMINAANRDASFARLAVNRKQKTDYKTLFSENVFKSITITFDETDFQSLLDSMQAYFDVYGTYRDNTMYPVDIRYQDSLGNDFSVLEVGFRTKSNTSRNLPMTYDWRGRKVYHQTSFQLQFNATFDYADNSNEHAILSDREVFNLNQLNFEFASLTDGDYDEAMISEAFAHQMYRDADVPVQNASYGIVNLVIGETLVGFGFYTFLEPIDKAFLSRHFDSDVANDYGDLYKATDIDDIDADLQLNYDDKIGINQNESDLRYQYALQNNTLSGLRNTFDSLTGFIERIHDADDFLTHAEAIIDVDLLLRTLAVDFLLGTTDNYRFNANNYYLYFEVYSGRAVFIPFDLDNVLGFGRHNDANYGVEFELFLSTDSSKPLIEAVFANDIYRNQYLGYLDLYANTLLDYDRFLLEYQTAMSLYQDILVNENHLGNQLFGLRNAEWYFTTKKANVLSFLAAAQR